MGCGSVPGKPVPQGAAGGFASAGIPRAHSKRLGNLPLIHGELVSAHKTDVFQVAADVVTDPFSGRPLVLPGRAYHRDAEGRKRSPEKTENNFKERCV